MPKKGELNEKTLRHIDDILDLLKTRGQIHLRGIARALNINQGLVSRIVERYLDFFIEVNSIEQFGFRAKLIRLKEGKENTTIIDVIRYLKVKEQIKGEKEPRISEAFEKR